MSDRQDNKLALKFADWASAITVLTVFAVICGLVEQSQYLRAIGAPWSVGLFSSADHVRLGSFQVVAIGMIFGLYLHMYRPVNRSRGRQIWLGIAITGVLFTPFFFVKQIRESTSPELYAMICSLLSGLATSLGTMNIVVAAADVKYGAQPLKTKHLVSVAIGALSALIYAPSIFGGGMGALDGGPGSRLSSATLVGEPAGANWLLVTTADKLFIVVQPAAERKDRIFRVVRSEDVVQIRTPPTRDFWLFLRQSQ